MSSREQLDPIIEDVAPKLERVLATDSLTSEIDASLQLRYSQCGLASTALHFYLLDNYQIETERVAVSPEQAPKNLRMETLTHVALRGDGYMIDPTYGQFMNFVGLTAKVAAEHNLAHLYPRKKIIVYGNERAEAFADKFASHAHSVDKNNLVPPAVVEYEPDGALRGKPLAAIQNACRSIWSPENYALFTNDDPDAEQGMLEAAQRIANSIQQL